MIYIVKYDISGPKGCLRGLLGGSTLAFCARYAETGGRAGDVAGAHAGGGGAGGRLELQGLWRPAVRAQCGLPALWQCEA